ncbi:ParB N-terminal domain-containing protein [Sinisalibacter aestuarii]|uniref:ParB-like N-terminal domain-containing protein n=1 Tax=Sinisalibacter aestuarii TaxID=2949426 RepID=A0ABQ5LYG1_9RHOB|nr:ParB N-terminal domain-containing protein [Sinisalibacter aestuarii]GKY89833.1 hypothetical protein STA1M1_37020 [Sinisalibacter aestuarii]
MGEDLSQQTPTNLHAGKNDLFREVTSVWLLVNLIDQAPRRVRRVLERQTEAVMRSIKRFGFRIPLLVRNKPGSERYEVVDGHTRLAAALRLGAEKLPCILVDDLPDVEIRRLVLSLNKLQETGEWDPDVLRLEINEIIEIDGDYEIPGFEIPEIDLLLQDPSVDGSDPDPLDDLAGLTFDSADPVTNFGDVWVGGGHTIACGRAQDVSGIAIAASMGPPAMVITDPPFNLRVNGHVSTIPGRHGEFAEASGEMQPEEFTEFLVKSLGAMIAMLQPGGIAFVFMDGGTSGSSFRPFASWMWN